MSLVDKKKFKNLKAQEEVQKRHTILLVDDERANLENLSAVFSRDYHIITADSGLNALDLIQEAYPNTEISLVICDQRMPGLSGVGFLEKMKKLSPNTIRIIMTGYADVNAIVNSINKAEIYKFILKPYDRQEIILTVQRALETYELRKQVAEHNQTLERKIEARTHELAHKNEELQKAYRELAQKSKELEDAYAKLETISQTDPLTGLKNRRFLAEFIQKEISLVLREFSHDINNAVEAQNRDMVFILLDLDRFKWVNDTYGHAAGDLVLARMQNILSGTCRSSDVLVRWGGEEFLVVSRRANRRNAPDLAERIRQAVAEQHFETEDGRKFQITCSLGFACFPFIPNTPELLSWENVVALADRALYTSKRSGRNQWVGIFGQDVSMNNHDLFNRIQADIKTQINTGLLQVATGPKPLEQLVWP